MPVRILDEPIIAFYAEQLGNTEVPANNGTRKAIAVREGYGEILIEPAAALRLHFGPRIAQMYLWDDSVQKLYSRADLSTINPFDRNDTDATTIFSQMTSSDYVYIATLDRIGGLYFDMSSNVNATAATLSLDYLSPTGFVNTAITDGTASGGATLAQDGPVTIDSVPAAGTWIADYLDNHVGGITLPGKQKYFWVRLSTSATIDANTGVDEIAAFNHDAGASTDTGGSGFFKASTEYTIDIASWVGSLEFIAQAAAATTCNLTWIKR